MNFLLYAGSEHIAEAKAYAAVLNAEGHRVMHRNARMFRENEAEPDFDRVIVDARYPSIAEFYNREYEVEAEEGEDAEPFASVVDLLAGPPEVAEEDIAPRFEARHHGGPRFIVYDRETDEPQHEGTLTKDAALALADELNQGDDAGAEESGE